MTPSPEDIAREAAEAAKLMLQGRGVLDELTGADEDALTACFLEAITSAVEARDNTHEVSVEEGIPDIDYWDEKLGLRGRNVHQVICRMGFALQEMREAVEARDREIERLQQAHEELLEDFRSGLAAGFGRITADAEGELIHTILTDLGQEVREHHEEHHTREEILALAIEAARAEERREFLFLCDQLYNETGRQLAGIIRARGQEKKA